MENKREKIGVDKDDTLLDFVGTYTKYHNKKYGTKVKREDFTTYSFDKVFGISMEEAISRVSEFYNTDFFKKMPPLPNSVEVINSLKQNYDLYVVTSAPDHLYIETMNQILKNFGNVFLDVFFSSNHYTGRKNSGKSKVEICLENGISILIDDSLEYALQCAEKGIGAFLFGDNNPWNQNGEHTEIIRVEDWLKVKEELLK